MQTKKKILEFLLAGHKFSRGELKPSHPQFRVSSLGDPTNKSLSLRRLCSASPGFFRNLGYTIVIAFGLLIILSTILLTSYIYFRACTRAWSTIVSGPTASSLDDIILPHIILLPYVPELSVADTAVGACAALPV
ncbi:hypothetical protein Scep_001892 [Stephania cephalantha]|uniref:Uncharacterized protein n=1 Tax=Stephania cephalantha TaxID=152367 RepID=A0AAP0L938_9MAGN